MRKIIALIAVVISCATLGLRAVAEDALSPIMTVIDAEDSVHVRLSWRPVRDARGEEAEDEEIDRALQGDDEERDAA